MTDKSAVWNLSSTARMYAWLSPRNFRRRNGKGSEFFSSTKSRMMVMHEENSNIKQYINKKWRTIMVYQYYMTHACMTTITKKRDFVELIWTQIFSFNTKNISNGLIKKKDTNDKWWHQKVCMNKYFYLRLINQPKWKWLLSQKKKSDLDNLSRWNQRDSLGP